MVKERRSGIEGESADRDIIHVLPPFPSIDLRSILLLESVED